MKKFSLFLSAMLISMMSFAGVVTFDADVDKGNAGTDSNNAAAYTITKDGVTVEVSSGILGTYNNEAHYRVYKNQTLTITSTVGNITSVEFTCTANGDAKYGPGCFTADSGDYTNDGAAVGTWTGSATEITFTASANQVRATQIVVTYGEAATDPDVVMYEVAAEECTVGEGYGTVSGAGNYAEGSTVTLTATPNPGYVFDSWDNGSKENPLTLTVTGNIYQCAVFIPQTPITIAEALALPDGTTGALNPFTVSYVFGSYIYIQDESGYALLYQGNYGLKAGDEVYFMAFAKSTYNDIPQLSPKTAYDKLKILPKEAPAVTEITTVPTVADNRLVKLMNASLAGPLAVKKTTVATCADESTINIYSQIDFTPEEGKTYNILGGVTQYKGVIQIQAYEVEEYVAPVTYYNIYLTAAPSEGGEVEGEGEFEAGEQVTVSALANEGYEFVNWTEGEEVVSTNANYTFEVTAERDLVANFQLMSETVYFINNDNWEGDIYAYAWKEGGSNNGEWPGVLATKLETPFEGFEEYDAYSYTALYGQYDYVIFTNGSQQTIDHPWVGNAFYYIEKGPAVAEMWTVAGTPIFGTAWDPTYADNDMRLQDDGTYVWEKTDLTLAANTQIEFKVVKDHAWDEAYPASNYKFSVAEDGIYTITITFDPTSTEVAAVATKTGDAEINVEISYVLMGVAGDWTTGIALTANPDNANEYVLLGQEIAEGDAVKVVTLTDGVATAYCGNVDEYSVAHTADADGNIVLAPGTYDFYYKVAEDLIYISAAGPVDPTPDPEEPKDITVKAKVPAEWTDQITVWVWPTGGEGQEAVPTQEGEWYVYTANVAELNIIFKNGAGWTGDQNQTEDITVTESTCIEITYNADGKAKHTEVDCEGGTPVDPTPDPAEVAYVLMGVAGDWTTGIALTANPENENEYMLLNQPIAEGDAVKVVTLTDGVATAWCGNVDEWSVEHQFDENGNIILAPGTYDFYYKVAEDLIYIGASEEPGDEPGDAIDATFVFNTEEGLTALGIELPVTDAGNGAFKTDLDETVVYTSNGVGMSVTHKADGSENGKTRVWKKASGALDLRIYKDGGSLTFAAPEGNVITKVVFDGAKINFAVGEDAVADNTWEGNVTSVTFAATATCNVNTVTVTYEAAAVEEPEIEWLEMPLEITNLTTTEIPVDDVTYLQLMGRDDMNDADVLLFLNNYTGEEKAYEVNVESSFMTFGGLELIVMDGSLTKSVDPELGDVYAGVVHAYVEEEGEVIYVAFDLRMYALPPVEIEIEDVTITVDEESAIAFFNATWEGTPLQVEVSGFEEVEFKEYPECWLSIGDDNVWVDAAAGPASIVIEGGVAMLKGEFTSYATGKSYYVTLTGSMSQDPGPATGLDNVQGEVKALKTIKNGQLIIVRDGKEFNAQGAVVK